MSSKTSGLYKFDNQLDELELVSNDYENMDHLNNTSIDKKPATSNTSSQGNRTTLLATLVIILLILGIIL